jgi:hypothetical protein
MRTSLVIGGTGPTGIHIVQGLVDRGDRVAILHRGTHERPETPAEVEHIHADPYDVDSLSAALAGREFDLVVAMYGRLRRIAELTVGMTGQFVSVGGVPAIRGWMNPWLFEPDGLPIPVSEQAPVVAEAGEDEKGFRVARTEQYVFDNHPRAAHFRYPYAYGPLQVVPRLAPWTWIMGRDEVVAGTRFLYQLRDDEVALLACVSPRDGCSGSSCGGNSATAGP